MRYQKNDLTKGVVMGEFSAWLKQQLNERNISFRQFEADTNIQRSNLTQYTKAKRQPSVQRCNQIADYFAKLDAKAENLTTAQQHTRFTVYLLQINTAIMLDLNG